MSKHKHGRQAASHLRAAKKRIKLRAWKNRSRF